MQSAVKQHKEEKGIISSVPQDGDILKSQNSRNRILEYLFLDVFVYIILIYIFVFVLNQMLSSVSVIILRVQGCPHA